MGKSFMILTTHFAPDRTMLQRSHLEDESDLNELQNQINDYRVNLFSTLEQDHTDLGGTGISHYKQIKQMIGSLAQLATHTVVKSKDQIERIRCLKGEKQDLDQRLRSLENLNVNLEAEISTHAMRIKQLEADYAELETRHAEQRTELQEAEASAASFQKLTNELQEQLQRLTTEKSTKTQRDQKESQKQLELQAQVHQLQDDLAQFNQSFKKLQAENLLLTQATQGLE